MKSSSVPPGHEHVDPVRDVLGRILRDVAQESFECFLERAEFPKRLGVVSSRVDVLSTHVRKTVVAHQRLVPRELWAIVGEEILEFYWENPLQRAARRDGVLVFEDASPSVPTVVVFTSEERNAVVERDVSLDEVIRALPLEEAPLSFLAFLSQHDIVFHEDSVHSLAARFPNQACDMLLTESRRGADHQDLVHHRIGRLLWARFGTRAPLEQARDARLAETRLVAVERANASPERLGDLFSREFRQLLGKLRDRVVALTNITRSRFELLDVLLSEV